MEYHLSMYIVNVQYGICREKQKSQMSRRHFLKVKLLQKYDKNKIFSSASIKLKIEKNLRYFKTLLLYLLY